LSYRSFAALSPFFNLIIGFCIFQTDEELDLLKPMLDKNLATFTNKNNDTDVLLNLVNIYAAIIEGFPQVFPFSFQGSEEESRIHS
jgi:hypothetical protein